MAAARTDGGGPILEDEAPAQNVCCNLCVRRQNRFVVLGCAHSFCWPCISSTALRLPPSEKEIPLLRSRMRSQSRDSLRGISPHGSLGHPSTMDIGTPVGISVAATPPGAANGAGWWPGDNDVSDSGAGPEDPRAFVKCAVCDSLEDLSQGHMEVNPLLGDYSYVWIAAPLPKNGRNHGTVRGLGRMGLPLGMHVREALSEGMTDARGCLRLRPRPRAVPVPARGDQLWEHGAVAREGVAQRVWEAPNAADGVRPAWARHASFVSWESGSPSPAGRVAPRGGEGKRTTGVFISQSGSGTRRGPSSPPSEEGERGAPRHAVGGPS